MTEQEGPSPQIPDFDLVRRVGSGGFGEVWLATNRTTGRLRAVKLVPLRPQFHSRQGAECDGVRSRADAATREISSLTVR